MILVRNLIPRVNSLITLMGIYRACPAPVVGCGVRRVDGVSLGIVLLLIAIFGEVACLRPLFRDN